METESRMGVARDWGEGRMPSRCLTGIKFPFYKMKGVMETHCSDGYITLRRYLTPLNCALKNG